MKTATKTISLAEAATQKTSDRRIRFTFHGRAMLSLLLSQQNKSDLTAIFGRDAVEDDQVAIFSIARKVKPSQAEMAQYTLSFGGEKRLDLAKLQTAEDTSQYVLDGFEVRILRAFLGGWLHERAAIGDRFWAAPILEQCE